MRAVCIFSQVRFEIPLDKPHYTAQDPLEGSVRVTEIYCSEMVKGILDRLGIRTRREAANQKPTPCFVMSPLYQPRVRDSVCVGCVIYVFASLV